MTMPEFEPVAYGVLEGRDIKSCGFGYIAAWPQACHEHINEAIAEHNIEGASTWKVVEFFTQDQLQQAYAAGQANHSVTCQIFGHVVGACSECNVHAEQDVNETNKMLADNYIKLAPEFEALQAELVVAKFRQISGFFYDEVPTFQQGEPVHEVLELITAEDCRGYVNKIVELQQQLVAAREEIKTLQANLRMAKWERAELELIEQLAASQANTEQLREALQKANTWFVARLNGQAIGGTTSSMVDITGEGLSTKPDNSALREHDIVLLKACKQKFYLSGLGNADQLKPSQILGMFDKLIEGLQEGVAYGACPQGSTTEFQSDSRLALPSSIILQVNEGGRLEFREDTSSSNANKPWCTDSGALREP